MRTGLLFCFSGRFMELQHSRAVVSGSLKRKKRISTKQNSLDNTGRISILKIATIPLKKELKRNLLKCL